MKRPAPVPSPKTSWDALAESFSRTRSRPWDFVLEFLAQLPKGARLLDAGAGNGRHSHAAQAMGLRPIAVDFSARLLTLSTPETARVQGMLQAPPFASGSFDAVLCVAAVHHIQGRAERIRAWRALHDVAAPGATLLASVWAEADPRFAMPDTENRLEDREPGDRIVWWTHEGLRVPRFTHLYAPGELAAELTDGGWIDVHEQEVRVGTTKPAVNRVAMARNPRPQR